MVLCEKNHMVLALEKSDVSDGSFRRHEARFEDCDRHSRIQSQRYLGSLKFAVILLIAQV
jgi:hypothetical protein